MGLVIFLAIFVLATVGVAIFLSGERVDLVTDKAYEKGVAYQSRIETLERTKNLASRPGISWEQGACVITFADSAQAACATGMIAFAKPDDASRDFSVPIQIDSGGVQRVPFGQDKSGRWNISIAWTCGGLEYFLEEPDFAQQ